MGSDLAGGRGVNILLALKKLLTGDLINSLSARCTSSLLEASCSPVYCTVSKANMLAVRNVNGN